MNEQQKRQLGQVVLLIVLVGALIASTMFMLRSLNGPAKKPAAGKPAAGAQAQTKPAEKKATGMPEEVPTTSGTKSAKALGNMARAQMDANMFKVYSMDPPRNPFALEERWYAPVLEEQLPGYPQLKDSKYFESRELYLPDIWHMFGDRQDWADVDIKREVMTPAYQLKGDSSNKDIRTDITVSAAAQPEQSYTGPPTREMTSPGWTPPTGTAPVAIPPGNEDLFQQPGPGEEGLPVPSNGEQMPRTGTPPPGDSFTCQGVTHRDAKSYALMQYNGQPFIVQEGTVLPPYYKVYKIQDDGVVLQDRRDESSKWVPITPGAVQSNTMPTSKPAPAAGAPAEPSLGLDQLLQMLAPRS